MIHNKSKHPVEVKKISFRLWNLRDEIEAAIGRRIQECEAAGVPLYIDDIKKFYDFKSSSEAEVIPLVNNENQDVNSTMEELQENSEEEKKEENSEEEKKEETEEKKEETEEKKEGEETNPEGENLEKAQEIMAEQKEQGLEVNKLSPILDRPFKRLPPDSDKITYGFLLLSDINMDSMLGFTKNKFIQGQSVTIEFLIPKTFVMSATVSYCHHYAMRSRIISSTKPDYRVQCRFSYSTLGERDNLRNFLISVEPEINKKEKS